MKRNLGLNLGLNSVGWGLVQINSDNDKGEILGMGSRIIPMSQDLLDKFKSGVPTESQASIRTEYRGIRRLRQRYLLRRERLHRILNIIDFLPKHYSKEIDFEKRYGKFKLNTEPKIAYDNARFIFNDSFEEMLSEFKLHHSHILKNTKGESKLVPYDWTLYYLRSKALSQKIDKRELAWILLNFNQKRGYYQLRGDEEEDNPNKLIEFYSLKIVDVILEESQKSNMDNWYSLKLENGWVYRRTSKTPLFDWKDKIRDFIVTTEINDDGSIKKDKAGNDKRSFRAPAETDWTLVKKKTENEIDKSGKTVGVYIYNKLLENPKQKIKGALVRTIERKFYRDELKQILEKQKEFHAELQNINLYCDCLNELYKNNDVHRTTLKKKDFVHLFLDDIIFYQRPTRIQNSIKSHCPLEYRIYKDAKGVECIQKLNTIAVSNPYYQEFRIWQWMNDLSIYKKVDDTNVTHTFIKSKEDYEKLFEFLNGRKEVNQKDLLKFILVQKGFLGKTLLLEIGKYRWNYVEENSYPCNETKAIIASRIGKVKNISFDFLTVEIEQQIWHIIYSVKDKIEYEKALKSFSKYNRIDTKSFVEAFIKFPPFKNEYGSFSEKAIKKMLPLMRIGKFWKYDSITADTKERIDQIISGEIDKTIKNKLKEKSISLDKESHFQGLQIWLAQYLIWGKLSKTSITSKWHSVNDLTEFLKDFKQHSLRNPIVEQVIIETLRVVKDIWTEYGNGEKDFFSEIHIELAPELKNKVDDRKQLASQFNQNENTNLRIKAMLFEMKSINNIENVRPFSPMQHEILKIYEDGVLNSGIEIADDILKISKMSRISSLDLKKYIFWLKDKYRSPYTGQIILLEKLFTRDYEIEHIIPRSRYFDDTYNNKVICEAAVNTLKSNRTGFDFISNFAGSIVDCGLGNSVKIFQINEFEDFVKKNYATNKLKKTLLLSFKIPKKIIERQLSDTRYVSKYITGVLSNIVRKEDSLDEGDISKNIILGNGKITTILWRDWGVNEVWNELVLPRFERMNQVAKSTAYTVWNDNYQKYLPAVPMEVSRGFSKKRIDYRYYALEAIIIACVSREHIKLLTNQMANSDVKRLKLKRKLMQFEKVEYYHYESVERVERVEREIAKYFLKPWDTFTMDVKASLETVVVSFKKNLRVVNKATNYYQKYIERDGIRVKERVEQAGINWAIRKPMHKEFFFAKVNLPWVKVGKREVLTAIRKVVDTSFDEKKIKNSITDTAIQKILLAHLDKYKKDIDDLGTEIAPEIFAFSEEGIEEMNNNIVSLNGGIFHQPIYKVRVFERGKGKFPVGKTGNKRSKYVEAAKGTNLFFAVYEDNIGKRSFETIPLNVAIERQSQGLYPVPSKNEKGGELLFDLSPNDLVYVPEENGISTEIFDFNKLKKEQVERIYKVVKSSGVECYFIRQDIASLIKLYDSKTKIGELESQNKLQITMTKERIKIIDVCIKIKVSRLGVISKV